MMGFSEGILREKDERRGLAFFFFFPPGVSREENFLEKGEIVEEEEV